MAEMTTKEKIKRWADKQGWLLLSEVKGIKAVALRFLMPDGEVKECIYYPDGYVTVSGAWSK